MLNNNFLHFFMESRLVVMSQELEKLSNQLFVGQIPSMWLAVSYGSRKPLAGYFTDLLARIEFCELFWCFLGVL